MIAEERVLIENTLGFHVRPSAAFAQKAAQFTSKILVIKDGQAVNGKSSIELLTLAAVQGTALMIRAEGEDALEAAEVLCGMVRSKFGEE